MKSLHTTSLISLTGAFAFAGAASASVVFTEDFESGTTQWAQGFGTYGTSDNYSGSSHGQIPGGGSTYGNLIASAGSAVDGGPITTQSIDLAGLLTSGELSAVASGTATWAFGAWLASYTADDETTLLTIEWFDAAGGAGTSLGTQTLADGSVSTGVLQSIDGGNPPSAGTTWTPKNWSEYAVTGSVPTGAASFEITYQGQGGVNNNDGYADNLTLTVVPEPTVTLLGGLGAMLLLRRRRP